MKIASGRTLIKLFLASSALVVGCTVSDNSIKDPVQWWAVNSYGSSVTIELYDNNCGRPLRDLRLRVNQEVMVVSCGDGQGQANVRFRREGYPSRSDPWSPDALLRANQRSFVR